MEPVVSFRNVVKVYENGFKALSDISLDVFANEFVSFVGPSGCGKSTLLKLVAGTELANAGEVKYQGKGVSAINSEVGFVTQDSNLFPWLTLYKNVEFPLAMRRVPRDERRQRIEQWISTVGLSGFENVYPNQLSGGMQKRAAIIRTLVYQPGVALMDEPFSALDAQTRMILQNELLQIWARNRSTILFVTHDLQEAVALSDRIVLFSKAPGRIIDVFDVPLSRPRNVFEIHEQEGFTETYHKVWRQLREQFDLGSGGGKTA